MNVLIYNGPEVLQTSASRTVTSLRSVLYPNYTVQAITHQSLVSGPWSSTCALLVIPACRLPLSSSISSSVKSFIENGGALLGLRAGMRTGGLLGGANLDYSFRLQDPASGTTLYCAFAQGEDSEMYFTRVKVDHEDAASPLYQTREVDFNGSEQARNVQVIARYSENNSIAAAIATIGSGKVALWGPHLEAAVTSEGSKLSLDEVHKTETWRQRALRSTLNALGLKLPISDPNNPVYPLPQFLLASRPTIVSYILETLSLELPGQFKDDHDPFAFPPASDAESLLQHGRSTRQADDIRHVIAYTDGSLPPIHVTPLFSPQAYFSELSAARSESTQPVPGTEWNIGDAIFYGEAVTSTQTLLDKGVCIGFSRKTII